MDIFLYNRNTIITANKLFNNSLVSSNTQIILKFPDWLQMSFFLEIALLFDLIKKNFLAAQCGTWDLSSWTGDQTCAPALAAWSLNHWLARGVPPKCLFTIVFV